MRRLLLLRHAKSERLLIGGNDLERRLTPRGRSDAPKLGAYMVRHALIPERAIVSTAVRARETWNLVVAAFTPTPSQVFDERLYDADPQAILQVIQECGRGASTLLIVGHNPGLHELASLLVASGDVEVRQRLNESFPTSGLVVIDFALDDWTQLHPHAGRLDHFVSPRTLDASTD